MAPQSEHSCLTASGLRMLPLPAAKPGGGLRHHGNAAVSRPAGLEVHRTGTPQRRSRSCPSATASSLRSRSFSSCNFRLASRSALNCLVRLGGDPLLIGQRRSPRGGLLVGEAAQSGEQWCLGSVVEEGPGDPCPGGDASDGYRSAIALQGVQDSVDTLDAGETSLLCGLGQVHRVVSPHRQSSPFHRGWPRRRSALGPVRRAPGR